MNIRQFFIWIRDTNRYLAYRTWLRLTNRIMKIATDSHNYRSDKIIDCIAISKQLYDKYCDNIMKKELSTHTNEIKYLEKQVLKQERELKAHRNMLIDIIDKTKKVISIKKKNSDEDIDINYLRSLETDKLLSTADIIAEKIKRLDL